MDLSNARILDIVVDNATLLKKCAPIGTPTDETRELARDMLATMYAASGIGLAAIQVDRPVRLIVFDAGTKESPRPEVMVDPVIDWSSKREIEMEEGCLSIPGRLVQVSRPSGVKVSYTDLDGTPRNRDLGGMPARIVQHEIDHLDGVLITRRAA